MRSAASVDGAIIEPGDELSGRRTILDALRSALVGSEVSYARGTGISEGTDAELTEALDTARAADVAIVVLGERSGLTDDSTTGEFRDRSTLGFLGRQQELLEAIVATGTPVVLVVVSGRPLAIEWAAQTARRSCSPGSPATRAQTPSPVLLRVPRTPVASSR